MDDISKHTLPAKEVDTMLYIVRLYGQELEQANDNFNLFDKYHHRKWFQKNLALTPEEAWEKRMYYAKQCERLELDIKYAKEKLAAHSWAKEQLEDSMTPYNGVNMKEITLVQKELF